MNFPKLTALTQMAIATAVPMGTTPQAELRPEIGNAVYSGRTHVPVGRSGERGTALDPEIRSYWRLTGNLKAAETSFEPNGSFWNQGAPAVIDRMELLESRTRRELSTLSSKVDRLTEVVQALSTPTVVSEVIYSRAPSADHATLPDQSVVLAFRHAITSGSLADFFNYAADEAIEGNTEMVQAAEAALTDGDPGVRAAAGRALSAMLPEKAISVLSEAIGNEKNRFVRSVLRGALAAARV